MSEQNIDKDELELNIDFSKYFKPEVREFFKKNKTLLSFMGVILIAAIVFGGSKFYNSYQAKQVASINGEAASTEQNGEGTGTTEANQVALEESSDSAKPTIAKLPFTGRGVSYVVKGGDNAAAIVKNVCGSEAKGYVETVVRNLNKIYPGQTLELICR